MKGEDKQTVPEVEDEGGCIILKIEAIVICGGKSAEHEVSLKTAMTVINAMDRQKYDVRAIYISAHGIWSDAGFIAVPLADPAELRRESTSSDPALSMGETIRQVFAGEGRRIVLPLIHGTNGEDGTLQGLLELLNVPYVGNRVLASAAGMDKEMTKRVMASAGIPQAAYLAFLRHEWKHDPWACLAAIERELGYPCYVKPANLGSSIGIHRCESRERLIAAIEDAFRYDLKIVVEWEIAGREVQIAVLGGSEPQCSVAGEFEREPAFFSYEQKYKQGPIRQRIPADLSEEAYDRLRQYAARAFRALCGEGLMRVDFFITEQGELYLNEVNTLPGFTLNSMFPVLWNQTDGVSYPGLIDRLIRDALDRHALKQSVFYGTESAAAAEGRAGR